MGRGVICSADEDVLAAFGVSAKLLLKPFFLTENSLALIPINRRMCRYLG